MPLLVIGGCLSVFALFSDETSSSCEPGNSTARDLSTFRSVNAREYALIVKNPEAHVGEKIIIYGVVTQFDSATGSMSFRADTSAQRKRAWYNYDTNTIVDAPNPEFLSDVVIDDLVTMQVEVLGATSYDTQIGGNTTAPKMCVRGIEVTGRAR